MQNISKAINSAIVVVLLCMLANMPIQKLHAQPNILQKFADSSLMIGNQYSQGQQHTTRLLFDFYHHHKPDTKVGNHLITGSWLNSSGRYGWDDFVHTNSMDPVFASLENEYSVYMSEQPFSNEILSKVDALIMVNPDNPAIIPNAKVINDAEIAAVQRFVKDGGSLMVMVNAGKVESESFEDVQLRKLVRRFGLDWNEDNTHGSTIALGDRQPYFYDIHSFHYGGGCTLNILPKAIDPMVLLNVYADKGYPLDTAVKGPGIVLVRYGKGKVILIGDTGSWTANMDRPWDENDQLTRQLFRYLKPDRGVRPANFSSNNVLNYKMNYASLQAIPLNNTLVNIKRNYYRNFSPRPITKMPYLEANADLSLQPQNSLGGGAIQMKLAISDFHWFDQKMIQGKRQSIDFIASRQGKLSNIKPYGSQAQWLATDISGLVALIPVDGIRPGDRWNQKENLRIPIFKGEDIALYRSVDMTVTYEGDTKLDGKSCRLLRASGTLWLDNARVSVQDLLDGTAGQMNAAQYKYYSPHGGRLLYKREQWVDMKTGIVLKAKIQTRVVTWIQDLTKPLPPNNDEIDDNMIASLAEVTTFTLE